MLVDHVVCSYRGLYCLIARVFGCEGGGVWIVRLSSERPSKSLGSILGIEFEAAALRFS